jgi:hypothetical protein
METGPVRNEQQKKLCVYNIPVIVEDVISSKQTDI